MADEKIQDFLASREINWQFNLSHTPWWGGQFERMVGLVKSCLCKSIGNCCFTWKDIEINLNKRTLRVQSPPQLPSWSYHPVSCRNWNRCGPGLRERHVMLNGKPFCLSVGDVVIIKSDEGNREECPLGIVEQLFEGKV